VGLRDGQVLWTMTYVEIPGLVDYSERISLYFEDEIVDPGFPAPYLNHHPTQLAWRRSNGERLETSVIPPRLLRRHHRNRPSAQQDRIGAAGRSLVDRHGPHRRRTTQLP
jgi:hypothetical protein